MSFIIIFFRHLKRGRNLNKTKKEEDIKKEVGTLKKLLADVDSNKLKIANGLIQSAAFMKATLAELEEKVNEEGALDLFEQGDYTYNREHPALKSFNTTIKNYSVVCKQLFDLLPKDIQKIEDDGFNSFVHSRDD